MRRCRHRRVVVVVIACEGGSLVRPGWVRTNLRRGQGAVVVASLPRAEGGGGVGKALSSLRYLHCNYSSYFVHK